jgi:mRNA interferase YafQ
MKPVVQTSQFKKDIKRLKKQGKNLEKLGQIIRTLANNKVLDAKHRDQALMGKWSGSRDCHLEPDWILIYRKEVESLYLERSGRHSDLFKK